MCLHGLTMGLLGKKPIPGDEWEHWDDPSMVVRVDEIRYNKVMYSVICFGGRDMVPPLKNSHDMKMFRAVYRPRTEERENFGKQK